MIENSMLVTRNGSPTPTKADGARAQGAAAAKRPRLAMPRFNLFGDLD
jgi:hypothetical protein